MHWNPHYATAPILPTNLWPTFRLNGSFFHNQMQRTVPLHAQLLSKEFIRISQELLAASRDISFSVGQLAIRAIWKRPNWIFIYIWEFSQKRYQTEREKTIDEVEIDLDVTPKNRPALRGHQPFPFCLLFFTGARATRWIRDSVRELRLADDGSRVIVRVSTGWRQRLAPSNTQWFTWKREAAVKVVEFRVNRSQEVCQL